MASLRNLDIGILCARGGRNLAAELRRNAPRRHPSPATPWHYQPVNRSCPGLRRTLEWRSPPETCRVVGVGTDHDTAAFAVATIRRWWEQTGRVLYPKATRLLVTADAGGSNGYRIRAWKTQLARLAAATGLAVTVCHFAPGTSKWNKIEHRLFSHMSMNWRGGPLVSHEVILELIAATRTRSGLRVQAELDQRSYPLGVRVSDRELAAVPLQRHDWHGEWNSTVLPDAA